jgi:hypothetical protein
MKLKIKKEKEKRERRIEGGVATEGTSLHSNFPPSFYFSIISPLHYIYYFNHVTSSFTTTSPSAMGCFAEFPDAAPLKGRIQHPGPARLLEQSGKQAGELHHRSYYVTILIPVLYSVNSSNNNLLQRNPMRPTRLR